MLHILRAFSNIIKQTTMIYTHFIANTPLCIQTNGAKVNDDLMRKLLRMQETLKEQTNDIEKIDVTLEQLPNASVSPRRMVATVHAFNSAIVASDSGKHWKFIIKQVQERLKRQLVKRKDLLKKQSLMMAG
jgi:ribosome-associated translation inhibitor RaiA